ncbi:MAG: hypothetical protein E7Z85_09605 [Methanosphaera stadtmanae]|nr:hypothetical protein [Methanosphaera stadtmanae]
MKILELERLLPRLNESARDVDSWIDEFSRIMALADITNPRSILTWAMECVEGKLRGTLQELHTIDEEGNEHFPSMREIKEAIENSLEVTPQEKCKRLQRMKIQRGESIKNFNWRYRKIYNSLPKLYQTFITIEDYADSIIYRPYARSQVITQRCIDLEDAFEEAELAERAEEGGNLRNETVMMTVFNSQPFYYRSNTHPFKQFNSPSYNYNYNGRQFYIKKTPRNYTNYNENREFTTNNFNTKFNSKNEIMQSNNLENTTQNIKDSKIRNNLVNNEIKQARNTFNSEKSHIICYRCGQQGHIYKLCPYSFKEFAKLRNQNNTINSNNHLNF